MEGLGARMDSLESSVTDVLRDGLAEVREAVENFATTKADRHVVAALQADVDELKRAAGA